MISKKFIPLLVFAALTTTSESYAAPAKQAASMCQGVAAFVGESDIAGANRSEEQLAFGLKLKPASHEVLIMGVQGTTIIRPGRYLASPSGKGVSIDLTWTDSRNASRYMKLRFDPDGTFDGSTGSSVVSNPGVDMVCGLLGDAYCQMAQVRSTVSISGICMDPE